jgi:hypothetical protein
LRCSGPSGEDFFLSTKMVRFAFFFASMASMAAPGRAVASAHGCVGLTPACVGSIQACSCALCYCVQCGDYFGEQCLVNDEPCYASMCTRKPTVLYVRARKHVRTHAVRAHLHAPSHTHPHARTHTPAHALATRTRHRCGSHRASAVPWLQLRAAQGELREVRTGPPRPARPPARPCGVRGCMSDVTRAGSAQRASRSAQDATGDVARRRLAGALRWCRSSCSTSSAARASASSRASGR